MSKRHPKASWSVGLVVAIVAVASLAFAATSPLLITGLLAGAELGLSTNVLPKGWFSGMGGAFDPTKTTLATECAFAETTCSPGATLVLDSASSGDLTPALNPAGHVVGYVYTLDADLSAYQNHFALHLRCDGAIDVLGCDEAVAVTVETTAYSAPGVCRTYTDGGVTRCASDTETVTLEAIQDPDVVEVCDDGCGIGPCVSACEHECQTITNNDARRACQRACVCDCKIALGCGAPECD